MTAIGREDYAEWLNKQSLGAERHIEGEYLTMNENSNTTSGQPDWDYSDWKYKDTGKPYVAPTPQECHCHERYCPYCGHRLPYPYQPYPHPWVCPWTPYPYWTNTTYGY